MHLAADAIPLGLSITGQQVPQLLVRLGNCLVLSSLGFLEHLGSLLNLHLASHNVNRRQDGVSRLHNFLEILQCRLLFCNSLGVHATLLWQPFLLDDTDDRNYVHDVFLVVPTEEDRYADVGVIRKLDLENGRIWYGCIPSFCSKDTGGSFQSPNVPMKSDSNLSSTESSFSLSSAVR